MVKKYAKVIWMIFLVQLAVIAVVLTTASVDDMTLARGKNNYNQYHSEKILGRDPYLFIC